MWKMWRNAFKTDWRLQLTSTGDPMNSQILLGLVLIGSLNVLAEPLSRLSAEVSKPSTGSMSLSDLRSSESGASRKPEMNRKTGALGKDQMSGSARESRISKKSDGGVAGGGGGGIKINGKVYTMAQAGLKFVDDSRDPFYVDAKSMHRAKEILKILGRYCPDSKLYGSTCSRNIVNLSKDLSVQEHVYKKMEIVDSRLFLQLKADYQTYVSRLQHQKTFALPAYTEGQQTSLFPDFTEAGDDEEAIETKAIYLIHEGLFYNNHRDGVHKITLDEVLRIEVAIVEVLENENLETIRAFLDAFAAYNNPAEEVAGIRIGNYLEYLKAMGISVPFNQLFAETGNLGIAMSEHNMLKRMPLAIDPYMISMNKHVEKSFFKTFFNVTLVFKSVFLGGRDVNLYLHKIEDLEFRGVEIYSKKTDQTIMSMQAHQFEFQKK